MRFTQLLLVASAVSCLLTVWVPGYVEAEDEMLNSTQSFLLWSLWKLNSAEVDEKSQSAQPFKQYMGQLHQEDLNKQPHVPKKEDDDHMDFPLLLSRLRNGKADIGGFQRQNGKSSVVQQLGESNGSPTVLSSKAYKIHHPGNCYLEIIKSQDPGMVGLVEDENESQFDSGDQQRIEKRQHPGKRDGVYAGYRRMKNY